MKKESDKAQNKNRGNSRNKREQSGDQYILDDIRRLISESQSQREERRGNQTVKLTTPYGHYVKTTSGISGRTLQATTLPLSAPIPKKVESTNTPTTIPTIASVDSAFAQELDRLGLSASFSEPLIQIAKEIDSSNAIGSLSSINIPLRKKKVERKSITRKHSDHMTSSELGDADEQLRRYARELRSSQKMLTKNLSLDEIRVKTAESPFAATMKSVDSFLDTNAQFTRKQNKYILENVREPLDSSIDGGSTQISSQPTNSYQANNMGRSMGAKFPKARVSASKLIRKYPRFCSSINFSDSDLKSLEQKHDVWIAKFMETCYDEAFFALSTPASHGKQNIYHGLNIGSLDAFPLLVSRVIAKYFSTMEIRKEVSLELLFSIETLMHNSEFARFKMIYDNAAVKFDGGRGSFFSKFLSEEYDIDMLALFLNGRNLVQEEMGHKLKDINLMRINIDEGLLNSRPGMLSLLEQTQTFTVKSTNFRSSSLSLPVSKSINHSAMDTSSSFRLDRGSDSSQVAFGTEKAVPLKLPQDWIYMDDVVQPEAPLIGFNEKIILHLCAIALPHCSLSDRQYFAHRVKDLAVNDLLRDDPKDEKKRIIDHIPAYCFFRTLCLEWKKLSAEEKDNFTGAAQMMENLKMLNEVYDDNNRLMKEAIRRIEELDSVKSTQSAKTMRLEKSIKRLDRKWQGGVATDEDLDKLASLREEIASAKAELYDLEESLRRANVDKLKLKAKIESLWSQTMSHAGVAPKGIDKPQGSQGALQTMWTQYITVTICKTLEINAQKFEVLKQSIAKSKQLFATTVSVSAPKPPPTPGESKRVISETRFLLVETLARIIARNVLNDAKRKVVLKRELAMQKHKLLLVYGDEEYRRKEAERIRLEQEEKLRKQQHTLMIHLVKMIAPDIVNSAINEGKTTAGDALYDKWWMLDLDPRVFVLPGPLRVIESKYQRAVKAWDRHRLQILFRALSVLVKGKRVSQRHSHILCYTAMSSMRALFAMQQRIKYKATILQEIVKHFLFRRRLSRHMKHQKKLLLQAQSLYQRQLHKKFQALFQFWSKDYRLNKVRIRCESALKERRFLICFYSWLHIYRKYKYAKMVLTEEQKVACVKIQMVIRVFIAKRRVRMMRIQQSLTKFLNLVMARRRYLRLLNTRRKLEEYSMKTLVASKRSNLRFSFRAWKLTMNTYFGAMKVYSAYLHDMQRRRFKNWLENARKKTAYLTKYAIKVQSIIRMSLVFSKELRYYRWRRATVKFQSLFRKYRAVRFFIIDIRMFRAARKIQRVFRGWWTRSHIDSSRIIDIHYAASNNNYDRLKHYIDIRPDLVGKIDSEGNNALHSAAKNAARRTLKLLMRYRLCDPNLFNYAGFSPLHLAIMTSAIHRDECCLYMMERGFDDDQLTLDGRSCTHLAAEYGHIVILKQLLDDGHETNLVDNNGVTILQAACRVGSAPCVKALLENDALIHKPGQNGTYAVHDAVTGGSVEVLHELLKYEPDVNAVEPNYLQTPLMWASQSGFSEYARVLILYNANINAKDVNGKTAAHYAAITNTSDIFHALREAEADFDCLDNEGNSPLHLAAYYNAFDFARQALEAGIYPSWQNDLGDQPAHIAARYNQIEMLKVIAEYDEHIGRMNYSHQTPLGVAKFYRSKACQDFLEKHYHLVEQVDGRNEVGEIWWDKAIDEATGDWELQMNSAGERWFVNKTTGEMSLEPPAMSLSKVKNITQQVELPIRRLVTLVKDENTLTKHAYYLEHAQQEAEIQDMNKDFRYARIIQKYARRKLAYLEIRRLRISSRHRKITTRFIKKHIKGFMKWKNSIKKSNVSKIQSAWRGFIFRKKFYAWPEGDYWARREYLARFRLRYKLWKVWLRYKQIMNFRALMLVAKTPRTLEGWQELIDQAHEPLRQVGIYEEYRLPGQRDIRFYRHAANGACTFMKPMKMILFDDQQLLEKLQAKKFGATLAQIKLTTTLQALWRGYKVRNYSRYVEKALHVCQDVEEKYLTHPEVDSNLYNYAVYCLAIQQDIDRARRIFLESLRRMQWRGPDVPFLLYAYAIFGMVTQDEEYPEIEAMLSRAKRAEEDRVVILRTKLYGEENEKPIDFSTFKYGKIFDLANTGFFKYGAATGGNALGWELYGTCRFLVYRDFAGAFDAFLEAFKYEPKNPRIKANFDVVMTYFHGKNKEYKDNIVKQRLQMKAQVDADIEENRRVFREQARKRYQAATRIKRWYKERKTTRIFRAFINVVKSLIHRETAANTRKARAVRR